MFTVQDSTFVCDDSITLKLSYFYFAAGFTITEEFDTLFML